MANLFDFTQLFDTPGTIRQKREAQLAQSFGGALTGSRGAFIRAADSLGRALGGDAEMRRARVSERIMSETSDAFQEDVASGSDMEAAQIRAMANAAARLAADGNPQDSLKLRMAVTQMQLAREARMLEVQKLQADTSAKEADVVAKVASAELNTAKLGDVGATETTRLQARRTELEGQLPSVSGSQAADIRRQIAEITAEIEKRKTPSSGVTVQLPPEEKAFKRALGTKAADDLDAQFQTAKSAMTSLGTINEMQGLLDDGIRSGRFAVAVQEIDRVLDGMGFKTNGKLSRTQAYASATGKLVGEVIRLFGSGTGLSDADREYALKIAGGDITLSEDALRRLLDINRRANSVSVARYNERRDFLAQGTPEVGTYYPRLEDGDGVTVEWHD